MNKSRDTAPRQLFERKDVSASGTHILDDLEIEKLLREGKSFDEIDKIFGNNWSFEKRAFFHERAFQKASGMDYIFATIEEMLSFIYKKYEQF